MSEVELTLEGVTGPYNSEWGIDLYVNEGKLELFIHNEYDRGNATLSRDQAMQLSNALREYANGQDKNTSSD